MLYFAPDTEEFDSVTAPAIDRDVHDTMIRVPEIEGHHGEATMNIELPDIATSWRLYVIAHTTDGDVGTGTVLLPVDE